jgi:Type I phosphodiesterase / nucleotide pyrophosphatase
MPIRWAYLKRVVAGAIFGLYMAHLLYFLNPQIDVAPLRLLSVTLAYCVICGLLIGTALWLLRTVRVKLFGNPAPEGQYRAHGFGFVVLAAFIASAVYWTHLYAFRDYLPVVAVRLLGKATNLITATAFALLILWFFERNADRRTSRAIFICGVFLIAVSSFFLYQRRDSYHTEKRTAVVANVGTVAGEQPVLVVAVRNLPYDWIVTIAGEGNLPFFENVREHAYFDRMEPFATTSQQSLWASLATGKLPYRHGVTGHYAYRMPMNGSDPADRFLLVPGGIGFRAWGLIPPVQRITTALPSGDALPLWTLVERLSFHSAVVNWPSVTGGATIVMTDRSVRAAPRLQRLAPSIAQKFNGLGVVRDRVLGGLAADADAIAAVRDLASRHSDELDVVALDGFSSAQRAMHIYRNALPARSSVKGEALRAYVQQLDAMLGALARDLPDHLLVVVSPCGPEAPELPVTMYALAREFLASDEAGLNDGFVLITGAVAAHRENPPAAKVVDLVPTVLFAAGLPVGRDMDGRVLVDAFDDTFLRRNALSLIPTYEAKEIVVRRVGT